MISTLYNSLFNSSSNTVPSNSTSLTTSNGFDSSHDHYSVESFKSIFREVGFDWESYFFPRDLKLPLALAKLLFVHLQDCCHFFSSKNSTICTPFEAATLIHKTIDVFYFIYKFSDTSIKKTNMEEVYKNSAQFVFCFQKETKSCINFIKENLSKILLDIIKKTNGVMLALSKDVVIKEEFISSLSEADKKTYSKDFLTTIFQSQVLKDKEDVQSELMELSILSFFETSPSSAFSLSALKEHLNNKQQTLLHNNIKDLAKKLQTGELKVHWDRVNAYDLYEILGVDFRLFLMNKDGVRSLLKNKSLRSKFTTIIAMLPPEIKPNPDDILSIYNNILDVITELQIKTNNSQEIDYSLLDAFLSSHMAFFDENDLRDIHKSHPSPPMVKMLDGLIEIMNIINGGLRYDSNNPKEPCCFFIFTNTANFPTVISVEELKYLIYDPKTFMSNITRFQMINLNQDRLDSTPLTPQTFVEASCPQYLKNLIACSLTIATPISQAAVQFIEEMRTVFQLDETIREKNLELSIFKDFRLQEIFLRIASNPFEELIIDLHTKKTLRDVLDNERLINFFQGINAYVFNNEFVETLRRETRGGSLDTYLMNQEKLTSEERVADVYSKIINFIKNPPNEEFKRIISCIDNAFEEAVFKNLKNYEILKKNSSKPRQISYMHIIFSVLFILMSSAYGIGWHKDDNENESVLFFRVLGAYFFAKFLSYYEENKTKPPPMQTATLQKAANDYIFDSKLVVINCLLTGNCGRLILENSKEPITNGIFKDLYKNPLPVSI